MTNLEVTLTRRLATAAEIAEDAAHEASTTRIGLVLPLSTHRYDVCVNSALIVTTHSEAFAKSYARRIRGWTITWNAVRIAGLAA